MNQRERMEFEGGALWPARLPRIAAALRGILGTIVLVVAFRINPAYEMPSKARILQLRTNS